MDYLIYAFLGVVQGLTEFIPVSSSGHLVIAQKMFPSFSSPGMTLEVFLHAGTLSAVIYYFRKDILKIDKDYFLKICFATIPAIIVGLLFREQIENIFDSLKIVGFALLITSFFNFFTDKKKDTGNKIDYLRGFIIGVFQALAIIPGVSRSGSTIFASRSFGVSAKESARFSFLLSIPAIIGANILEASTLNGDIYFNIGPMLIGFAAAFVSGLFAIGVTIRFLEQKRFKYFAVYTLVVGILILLV